MVDVIPLLREAGYLVLFLDYDGTLVPFAPTPEGAAPDGPLLRLLEEIARRPRTDVHIVSGRPRATLDEWLGALPVGLHAEHGFWSRLHGVQVWTACADLPQGWKPRVLELFAEATVRLPGTRVEEKASCVAWHYRQRPERGPVEAATLSARLARELAAEPFDVMHGDHVLEVRARGVNKGGVVERVLRDRAAGELALPVAIGDDVTDEDLFAALPAHGIAIHVGAKTTRASRRVATFRDVRALLHALL